MDNVTPTLNPERIKILETNNIYPLIFDSEEAYATELPSLRVTTHAER